MTAHGWYVENRVAFATKTLGAKDAKSFANHLSRCEECRVAVAQIETELAWLPMGVTPVAPRPGLTHACWRGVRVSERRAEGVSARRAVLGRTHDHDQGAAGTQPHHLSHSLNIWRSVRSWFLDCTLLLPGARRKAYGARRALSPNRRRLLGGCG